MPRGLFLDVPGGDTVEYDVVDDNGYRMCKFGFTAEEARPHFESIRDLKCRQDDILLCSYPKTGANWLWEMLMMLLQKQTNVTGGTKLQGMLEATKLETIDQLPSPRMLNTHIKVKHLPKEAIDMKLKTLFLVRNPKSVAVSFYNHTKGIRSYKYSGKFDNFLEMFIRGEVDFGSYPEYLLEWQECMRANPDWPVLVVYYEDLKEDGFKEMKKISEFLKQDISDDVLRAIVENCSVDKMKKSKQEAVSEDRKEQMADNYKGGFNLIRKGQIAEWKKWFTIAQNEAFDKWWENSTKGLDVFKFRYS